jgi:predicted ABC-type transport system involved in lysophospholipase L1 biosynthesis ATPase subunit
VTGNVPIFEIEGLRKDHQALRPLRITKLAVRRGDHLAIHGLDARAAEAFSLLVTGAMLPDEGDIRVAGRSTRDIGTDTEWLASLDRFGMVTDRAVLIDGLSLAANLALPLTLAIDPMSAVTRAQVTTLARDVGLDVQRLDVLVSAITPVERLRLHVARALALGPDVLLLEHPTAKLEAADAAEFGRTLKSMVTARGLAFVALTEDDGFARASGARRLRLAPATGALSESGDFASRFLSVIGRRSSRS